MEPVEPVEPEEPEEPEDPVIKCYHIYGIIIILLLYCYALGKAATKYNILVLCTVEMGEMSQFVIIPLGSMHIVLLLEFRLDGLTLGSMHCSTAGIELPQALHCLRNESVCL